MENIIIVDPFSTGVNFLEDIRKRGYHPVGLWSKRSNHIYELMKGVRSPIENRYRGIATFMSEDSDYNVTLNKVKELKPLFILPGADLGIELAAMLAEDLGLPGNPVRQLGFHLGFFGFPVEILVF